MSHGTHIERATMGDPAYELVNSLKRLEFYYDCVKNDIEGLIMGLEKRGEAAVCLEGLAWELEQVVGDIKGLANRLREQ